MTFYHGGTPGLKPGDYILPPSATGADSTTDQFGIAVPAAIGSTYQSNRVYVTPDFYAAMFIALVRRPDAFDIYEVEPTGEVAETTFTDTAEHVCEKAVVVDVLEFPCGDIDRMRAKMLRQATSKPLLYARLIAHERSRKSAPTLSRKTARRAFERKQRKIHMRARKKRSA